MKLFVKSKNGKMLKVGDTSETAKWYFMTDEVMKEADNFNVGEDVSIQHTIKQGSAFITDLKRGDTATSKPAIAPKPVTQTTTKAVSPVITGAGTVSGTTTPQPAQSWVPTQAVPQKSSYNGFAERSPEVQNSIKRQAIGNMTSRTLIGMQGIVTPENVEALIEQVYNKYASLIG